MYIKLPNEYPYNIRKLGIDNPNICFPEELSEELLNGFNVYSVNPTSIPTHNPIQEYVEEAIPVLVNNVWTQQWSIVAFDATIVKAKQTDNVKAQAVSMYTQAVVDTNGIMWRGGMDSATSIKNGVDMAEFIGQTTITLRDINFDPHVMSINDARTVAATIGVAWQTIFQAEEEAKRQLNLVDLESPTAVDELLAISIENYLPQGE